jgi:hypothetical protein
LGKTLRVGHCSTGMYEEIGTEFRSRRRGKLLWPRIRADHHGLNLEVLIRMI